MRNKFIIACVAVIIFSISLCTLVGCNTTNESTDRIEKAINQSNNNENNETVKDDNEQTVINNYNSNYYDNSTTNNITNNYNYNTDTEEKKEETDDDNVVKVYVTEGTITNEDGEEEYREYNDYSNNNNNTTTENNTITPIGDEKYDMDPDPNIVHIKNIKCPSCGAHSYIEHYNKADTNLQFYMGICNSCGYER